MKIEEIPSDKIVVMTDFWHKAFNAAGCNPMCHCCKSMIGVDSDFKLSTIEELPKKTQRYLTRHLSIKEEESIRKELTFIGKDKYAYVLDYSKNAKTTTKEVMLCNKCTPKLYLKRQKDALQKNTEISQRLERLHDRRGGGCFRVNGKILH